MLQLCVRSLRQKNLPLVMWTIQKRSTEKPNYEKDEKTKNLDLLSHEQWVLT
jgi:hypothetical protein